MSGVLPFYVASGGDGQRNRCGWGGGEQRGAFWHINRARFWPKTFDLEQIETRATGQRQLNLSSYDEACGVGTSLTSMAKDIR